MEILMNKYQTPITEELISQYPEEVIEQLYDCINNVPFIKNLTSPNRPYAKDLPRDENNRIIVNLTNPHIIEDADFFRQSALHYMKHGCYTFLKPNSNPNSEFRKFWDEEIRRCYEGYVRHSDGEWVTGYCYWFLNYCPMMVNKLIEGTKKAIRTESFPFFFEGIYWRFHYLHQAREAGNHAIELAKRGAGKAHPYNEKVFTPDGWKLWEDINIGDTLFDDNGGITKVIDIPFNDYCDIYEVTLRDGRKVKCSEGHLWDIEIHNRKGIHTMSTKEIMDIYKRQRKVSDRNPNGIELLCAIPRNKGIDMPFKETKVDPYTFGLLLGDGSFRHQSCYLTQLPEDLEIERPFIPYNIISWKDKFAWRIDIPNWGNILREYGLYFKKSEDKFIPDEYKYNSREVRLNVLKGLMDSDGTLDKKGRYIISLVSKQMIDDISFICRSLGYNCSTIVRNAGYKKNGVYIKCLPCYSLTIYTRDKIANLPRKIKEDSIITNEYTINRELRTKITDIKYIGRELAKCVTVDNDNHRYLIGDFITTHNSYGLASIMSHNLILGENEDSKKRVITVLTAYQKEYLSDSKDGTLSKFKPEINFVFSNTPFPRLMLKNSPNEMTWQMGYKDEYGIERGSLNQVMAVSAKDDSEKLRGKRGWILFEEMGSFKGLLSLYDITRKSVEDGDYTFAMMYLIGCVCQGTKVWTLDGRNINIEELVKEDGIIGFTDSFTTETNPIISLNRGCTKEPIVSDIFIKNKECVKVTLNNKNFLECSVDHPILIQKFRSNHDGSVKYYEEVFKPAGDLKPGDRVIECREVPIFGNDTLFDARLIGMLIGDGSYGLKNSSKFSSEDEELLSYVKAKYNWGLSASHITKKGKQYEDIRIKGICKSLKDIGIYGQTKNNKRLPIKYQTLDRENTVLLLSGLYDTDGSVYFNKKDGYISLTQSNKDILEQVKILWRKFGVIGTITETQPKICKDRKDKNPWYTLVISGRYNCLKAAEVLNLLVKNKKDSLDHIKNYYINNPSKKEQLYPKDIIVSKVLSIENIGIKPVYNLTAGLSHTYLANNIVTHNTAAEDESDFSSAKTLLYNPEGYNIYHIDNVFDRSNRGKKNFGFFFPSYINRAGCYNKDGVSDVVKALLEILMFRHKAKYSADPKSVLRLIAEDPITPEEAIIKVKAAYFPVTALNERLSQIDTDPNILNNSYVGSLTMTSSGEVKYVPTSDEPIRKYGVSNNTKGAIEIFQMPEKNIKGEIIRDRYIVGHDPVDNDQAESSSLSSTFVLDLFTDTIVAEYTGRHEYSEDNYEVCRLLCLFYNAKCLYESNKKGLFAYFSKMNCTHLLADTPEYLRDKQLVKYSSFGSNAHPYDEKVYTPDGIKQWEDIKVGDYLYTPHNTTTKVVDIPIDEELDIYEVYLKDGRVIQASDNHIWEVWKGSSKTKKSVLKTTKEIMEDLGYIRNNKSFESKYYIKCSKGVEFEEKEVPMNPYMLGLMLGDGSMSNKYNCCGNRLSFTSSKEDMEVYMNYLKYNYKYYDDRHCYIEYQGWGNIVKSLKLNGCNSHTKFIPELYKYNSREVRMEILKGLMDSDGTISGYRSPTYTTVSKQLAEDIMELIRSLGMNCNLRISTNKYGPIYNVIIYTKTIIFRLPRKIIRQLNANIRTRDEYTGIINIKYIGKKKAKCVTVDSEDGLYLINDFVTTHNCKGVNASAAINNYANERIREWLLKPVITQVVEDGVPKEVTMPNLFTIKSRALLEELIAYTPELNVDRIRALGMVMLYREEKMILFQNKVTEDRYKDSSYLGNDDFFNRNYKRRQ